MKVDLAKAISVLADARYEDIDESVANALHYVGMGWLQKGNWIEAFKALDEAFHICLKLGNELGNAQVSLSFARLFYDQEKMKKAEFFANKAIQVFTEYNDVPGKIKSLEILGNIMNSTNRSKDAIIVFRKALNILIETKDYVGQVFFQQYLSITYNKVGDKRSALNSYRSLGRLSERLGDYQRVALAAVGVGTMLKSLSCLEKSLEAFQYAKDIYRRLGQLGRASQIESEIKKIL